MGRHAARTIARGVMESGFTLWVGSRCGPGVAAAGGCRAVANAARRAQASSRFWQRIAGHLASEPLPGPACQTTGWPSLLAKLGLARGMSRAMEFLPDSRSADMPPVDPVCKQTRATRG